MNELGNLVKVYIIHHFVVVEKEAEKPRTVWPLILTLLVGILFGLLLAPDRIHIGNNINTNPLSQGFTVIIPENGITPVQFPTAQTLYFESAQDIVLERYTHDNHFIERIDRTAHGAEHVTIDANDKVYVTEYWGQPAAAIVTSVPVEPVQEEAQTISELAETAWTDFTNSFWTGTQYGEIQAGEFNLGRLEYAQFQLTVENEWTDVWVYAENDDMKISVYNLDGEHLGHIDYTISGYEHFNVGPGSYTILVYDYWSLSPSNFSISLESPEFTTEYEEILAEEYEIQQYETASYTVVVSDDETMLIWVEADADAKINVYDETGERVTYSDQDLAGDLGKEMVVLPSGSYTIEVFELWGQEMEFEIFFEIPDIDELEVGDHTLRQDRSDFFTFSPNVETTLNITSEQDAVIEVINLRTGENYRVDSQWADAIETITIPPGPYLIEINEFSYQRMDYSIELVTYEQIG